MRTYLQPQNMGENGVGKQYVRSTKSPGRLYPVIYGNVVLISAGNLSDKTEHALPTGKMIQQIGLKWVSHEARTPLSYQQV